MQKDKLRTRIAAVTPLGSQQDIDPLKPVTSHPTLSLTQPGSQRPQDPTIPEDTRFLSFPSFLSRGIFFRKVLGFPASTRIEFFIQWQMEYYSLSSFS